MSSAKDTIRFFAEARGLVFDESDIIEYGENGSIITFLRRFNPRPVLDIDGNPVLDETGAQKLTYTENVFLEYSPVSYDDGVRSEYNPISAFRYRVPVVRIRVPELVIIEFEDGRHPLIWPECKHSLLQDIVTKQRQEIIDNACIDFVARQKVCLQDIEVEPLER